MLSALHALFVQDVVPAVSVGGLRGAGIDALLLERLKTDVLSIKDLGRPPGLETALEPGAAAGLAGMTHLTKGARDLISDTRSLEQAIVYLFADKSLKEHLRTELKGSPFGAPLNRLLSATPALLEYNHAPAEFTAKGGGLRKSDEILADLKLLDDETLRRVLVRAYEDIIPQRTAQLFREKNWDDLNGFSELIAVPSLQNHRILLNVARANIYSGALDDAIRLFGLGKVMYPKSSEIFTYSGVAHARSGNFDTGVADLKTALSLSPSSARIKRELGNVLRTKARRTPGEAERRAVTAEAIAFLSEALEQDYSLPAAKALARFHHDSGAFDTTAAMADHILATSPEDIEALILKSRALVSGNRVAEALALSSRVIELDPGNQTAAFMLRALRFLAEEQEGARVFSFGDLSYDMHGLLAVASLEASDWQTIERVDDGEPLQALRGLPYDWVRLNPQGADAPLAPDQIESLRQAIDATIGCHVEVGGDGTGLRLWRREAILGLFDSGLVQADLSKLAEFESYYVRQPRPRPQDATVILMSRHGSFKFGGGEHFIESMAEHYGTVGYAPLIAGTRGEFRGQSAVVDGIRTEFVSDEPAALRRFFLSEQAHLVHAISGLGFAVAEALNFSNIPFIYGVHFWREALGTDTDDYYFDGSGNPVARPEFNYVLSRASTVYANSEFTRDVLERAFGVRCPVVFSVPKDAQAA